LPVTKVSKVKAGFNRDTSRLLAFAAAGASGAGGALHRFPVREEQPNFQRALEMGLGELLDAPREPVPYPLLYEPIGRDQRHRVGLDAALQRLDPGAELLGR
jgi:hypothetical protein